MLIAIVKSEHSNLNIKKMLKLLILYITKVSLQSKKTGAIFFLFAFYIRVQNFISLEAMMKKLQVLIFVTSIEQRTRAYILNVSITLIIKHTK